MHCWITLRGIKSSGDGHSSAILLNNEINILPGELNIMCSDVYLRLCQMFISDLIFPVLIVIGIVTK
jgi:hypothetical protein